MSQTSMADVEAGSERVAQAPRSEAAIVEFETFWQLSGPFYIPAFLMLVLKGMATIMMPLEVLALGFSYDTVGVLVSLIGLGSMAANMPAAILVSMTSTRTGTVVASALFFIAAACCTVVTFLPSENWTVLILGLAFLAVGCGDAVGAVARMIFFGACVRPSLRSRTAATEGAFNCVGSTLGPLLAGIVAEYAMSRSVYLLMGALALLVIVNALVCIPAFNPNQSIEPKAKKNQEAKDVEVVAITTLDVVRKHWRILCICAFFCSFLIMMRRARELFFALEGQRFELSHSQIGTITAISFAVSGIIFPVGGWMLDHVGRVRTGALSILGSGASMLILQGDTFACYVAFAVVSGLFSGISVGLVPTLISDLAPAECRSQFVGIFRTLVRCADIAAPALIGAVAEMASLKTAGMIMAGASVVGAAFGLSFLRETASISHRSMEAGQALRPTPAKIGKEGEDSAEAPMKQI